MRARGENPLTDAGGGMMFVCVATTKSAKNTTVLMTQDKRKIFKKRFFICFVLELQPGRSILHACYRLWVQGGNGVNEADCANRHDAFRAACHVAELLAQIADVRIQTSIIRCQTTAEYVCAEHFA